MTKDGYKQPPSLSRIDRKPFSAPPKDAVPDGTIARQDKAWFSVGAHLRIWLTAMAGLSLDLITKSWAVRTLGDPDKFNPQDPDTYLRPVAVIKNFVTLITVHNHGAVGGIAQGKTTFLVIASFVAMGFLFWLFFHSHRRQWFCHIAMGLLLGGALGNLHDRLFNAGKVVDFIEVDLHVWPANPWPTFNAADVLLCVGVAMLILGMGLHAKRKPSEEE